MGKIAYKKKKRWKSALGLLTWSHSSVSIVPRSFLLVPPSEDIRAKPTLARALLISRSLEYGRKGCLIDLCTEKRLNVQSSLV